MARDSWLMLIIGVFLIVAGALVLAFLGPEPLVRLAGGALILIGLFLVVWAIFATSDVSVHDHGQSGQGQQVARSSWGRARE
jgi:Mn2+/Fe2+ NRAMP family transporter